MSNGGKASEDRGTAQIAADEVSADVKFEPIVRIVDLDPFTADPVLGHLRSRNLTNGGAALLMFSVTALIIYIFASIDGGTNGFVASRSLWRDISASFRELTRFTPPQGTVGEEIIPLWRDYQSLLAAFVIACAPWFIYGLFRSLERLHSRLVMHGCVERSSTTDDDAIIAEISKLNDFYGKVGRWWVSLAIYISWVAVFIVIASVTARFGTFDVYGAPDELSLSQPGQPIGRALYENWWARPIRPGFFAFSLLGAAGMYFVTIEAIVGLTYVRFLRGNSGMYRFRASNLNVDSNFGWSEARTAYTFMLAGVVTTILSTYPFYRFLTPAIPSWIIAVFMTIYLGVVAYVSVRSAWVLRRHISDAKRDTLSALAADLEALRLKHDVESSARTLVLRDEFRYVQDSPDFPVAVWWTLGIALISVLTIGASIAEIAGGFR